MKKLVIVVIVSVMCLSMAFPASALIYMAERGQVTVFNIESVDSVAKNFLPSGYDYRMVTWNSSAADGYFYIYYTNTPTFDSNTNFYIFSYSPNYPVTKLPNAVKFPYGIIYFNGKLEFKKNSTNGSSGNSSWNGYLVEYTNTYPSNIDSIKASAAAAGYDLEYTLIVPVDTTALQALITTAKSEVNAGYSATTWQSLQNAITSAENLLATTGYTQEQIDNEKDALQAALDGLQLLPDISELQALIETANAIEDTGYTSETWQALQAAVASATEFCGGNDYIAAQVESEITKLQTAIDGLALTPPPPVLPDTVELVTLLDEADQIEDIGYTVPTWTRFDNARIAGHELLLQPVYTQPEVNAASSELMVSMNGLTLEADVPNIPSGSGFDLGSGDISGFLAPAFPLFLNYVVVLRPVLIAFLAIIVGIKILPVAFHRMFHGFRR